jgi:hypothetical protein
MAAGLPVVSTAIPEAEKLAGPLHIGRTKYEFLEKLDAVIQSGKTGPQMSISLQMESESWDNKVEELSRILEGLPIPSSQERGASALDTAIADEFGT